MTKSKKSREKAKRHQLLKTTKAGIDKQKLKQQKAQVATRKEKRIRESGGRVEVDLEGSYRVSCEHGQVLAPSPLNNCVFAGPALCFVRTHQGGHTTRFYACAVLVACCATY